MLKKLQEQEAKCKYVIMGPNFPSLLSHGGEAIRGLEHMKYGYTLHVVGIQERKIAHID